MWRVPWPSAFCFAAGKLGGRHQRRVRAPHLVAREGVTDDDKVLPSFAIKLLSELLSNQQRIDDLVGTL